MSALVPNYFPPRPHPLRLAIVGEAPGRDEELQGRPFVGVSGRLLRGIMAQSGLDLDDCFVGNITSYRPPNNDISHFSFFGPEIQQGLAQLTIDLREFKPNIVVCLGGTSLKAAREPDHKGKKPGATISDWRGSLFRCEQGNSPMFGYKCMATYHPAYVLRDYSTIQIFRLDLKRAIKQATSPKLHLPEREYKIPTSVDECVAWIRECRAQRLPTACDIEGYVDNMTMCSFANRKDSGFIVPFAGPYYNGSFWPPEDELIVWREFASLLEDPEVPKILQNSLYDRFVLQYGYGIMVRNVRDDIMLKHWELFCELDKSLGFQASIYTYEPFYKSDRKSDDWQTKYRYCIKDSCITAECNEVEDRLLKDPGQRAHYNFNVAMLEPLLYMENRGLRYDVEGAAKCRQECLSAMYKVKHQLDGITGFGVNNLSPQDRKNLVDSTMLYKDKSDVKAAFVEAYPRAILLTTSDDPTSMGELSSLCGVDCNVKSTKFQDYLYNTLRLPLQTNDITGSPTANYEALLNLWKKTKHPVCDLAIQIRELATREQMLGIKADPDGRIRCGYNVVGSETGRVTCYTSPTGSGYNLQTLPADNPLRPEGHPLHKGMRCLILADDGCRLWQCDLEGADSWTVAAYCAMLGDRTMLEDLLSGLKPAQVLTMLYREGIRVNSHSRDELKALWKQMNAKKTYEYFLCKIGTHGSCYTMGVLKLARQSFVQSEGAINVPTSEIEKIQSYFFHRYKGVKSWHAWMTRKLNEKSNVPTLRSASGHVRQFFGRRNEILGEALADEPQNNTTEANNRAILNLWLDLENVDHSTGRLRNEILHQIHDAGLGQFHERDIQWGCQKIRQYFNNPLTIAGQKILIPFEGGYGRSWGELEEGKI